MICQKCKAELLDVYTFCPQCGSPLNSADDSTVELVEEITDVSEPVEEASEESVFVKTEEVPPVPEETPVTLAEPVIEVAPIITAPPVIEPALSVEPAPPAAPAPVIAPVEIKKDDASPAPVIPKEYKPLKTAGVFWYYFLTAIPVVNLIVVLSFAFASKNKNRKSIARATLIWWIIAIILFCGLFTFVYFALNGFMTDLVNAKDASDIADAFNNISFGS